MPCSQSECRDVPYRLWVGVGLLLSIVLLGYGTSCDNTDQADRRGILTRSIVASLSSRLQLLSDWVPCPSHSKELNFGTVNPIRGPRLARTQALARKQLLLFYYVQMM